MSNYTITPVTVYRVEGRGSSRDVSSLDRAEQLRNEWDGIDRANEILEGGGTLGDAMAAMGRECPSGIAHLTQGHGIQTRWQGTDLYAYSISHINEHGDIYVSGVGGWSGRYGSTVTIGGLARYPNRLGVESGPRAGGAS